MKSKDLWATVAILTMGGSLAFAVDSPSEPANVKITIVITQADGQGGPSSRSYELITATSGSASLNVGSRTPIPTRAAAREDGGQDSRIQMLDYSYHDVGFHTTVETRAEEDHRVRLTGIVEVSSVRDDQSPGCQGAPPVLETVAQRFDVVAEDGASIPLLTMDDPSSHHYSIELQTSFMQ